MLSDQNSRSLAIVAVGAALIALFLAAALIGAFGNGVPQELWASAGALGGALVGVLVPPPKAPATPSAAAAAAVVDGAALRAATFEGQQIISGDPSRAPAVVDAVAAVRRTSLRSRSGTMKSVANTAVVQHEATAAESASTIDPVSTQITQAAAKAATDALPSALDQHVNGGGALPAWVTWVVSALWQIGKPLALAAITYFALRAGVHISDGSIVYHNCPVTTATPAHHNAAPCTTALFQAGTALITLGAAAGGALVGMFAPPSSSSGAEGGAGG
jgi:hypothetical protein